MLKNTSQIKLTQLPDLIKVTRMGNDQSKSKWSDLTQNERLTTARSYAMTIKRSCEQLLSMIDVGDIDEITDADFLTVRSKKRLIFPHVSDLIKPKEENAPKNTHTFEDVIIQERKKIDESNKHFSAIINKHISEWKHPKPNDSIVIELPANETEIVLVSLNEIKVGLEVYGYIVDYSDYLMLRPSNEWAQIEEQHGYRLTLILPDMPDMP